jgi:hypothetical protein
MGGRVRDILWFAMLDVRARVLLFAALAGACLPAFAPPLRARGVHRSVRTDAKAADCLACHPTELDLGPAAHTMRRGEASVVPKWMLDDTRGCVGCHHVRVGR